MSRITSMKNPLVKEARLATVDAGSRSLLLQDWAACRWALDAGLTLKEIFLCDDGSDKTEIGRELSARQLVAHRVSLGIMQKIKQTKYASSVVAICDPFPLMRPPEGDLVLLLDQLQDPGNIGTIIRSARAFGVSHIGLIGKSALFHKKSVSASRGHVFTGSYQVFDDVESAAAYYHDADYSLVRTTMSADMSLDQLALEKTKKMALIVGNETAGCDAEWETYADLSIRIPMNSSVESLNVAVAASLCCYALNRP